MFPFDIGFGIRYRVKWHKQEKQLEPVWNKWFSEKMDRQIYEHFLGVLNIGTIKQIHRIYCFSFDFRVTEEPKKQFWPNFLSCLHMIATVYPVPFHFRHYPLQLFIVFT